MVALGFLFTTGISVHAHSTPKEDDRFVSYIADVKNQEIKFYWENDLHEKFKNIGNLEIWLGQHHKKLVFAMNGGMYKPDNSPQGLYIENEKLITPLDNSGGIGNFYVKPNGVFYITTGNVPGIATTTNFTGTTKVKYATQSGPMLVIEGQIHPAFKEGSPNLNIRNGVGILPDGRVIFAMSKKEINFYDFANYFRNLGCKNALYFDGLVSRTYLPDQNWIQTDGNLGVLIGITSKLQ